MLQDILTDYPNWVNEQDALDNRFVNGEFSKWEYARACMELFSEHMPVKDSNVRSLSYQSYTH